MGKLLMYTFILLGIQIMLSLAGYSPGQHLLLSTFDVINAPQNITFTSLFGTVTSSIFTTTGFAAIFVGVASAIITQNLLLGGVAALFATFVADFASIIQYMGKEGEFGVFGAVITIIYGLLLVGYILAVIEWWRSSD